MKIEKLNPFIRYASMHQTYRPQRESSISYAVRMWCNCADYWDVYFASLENIRACFAEANVEMTYNHLNVHIVEK